MKNKLSCVQVIALFNFYIEGKLNSKLKESIDSHLKTCPECSKFYSMKGLNLEVYSVGYTQDDKLIEAISAYIDNELDDNEAVKMRKIAITNPIARKKLEDMYAIKQEMHNYFNKIKNDCKIDYSKHIVGILNGEKVPDPFNKLVWTFTAMLSVILAGFIVMLYF